MKSVSMALGLMIAVVGCRHTNESQSGLRDQNDDEVYLAAAERTMKSLVSDLTPKVRCFSHEEGPLGPTHSIDLYETTDPNYAMVLKYVKSPGLATVVPRPIYRRIVSDTNSLDAANKIDLRLQANYGLQEVLWQDGVLRASLSTGARGEAGFYDVTEKFEIASRKVEVEAANLSCMIARPGHAAM